MPTRVLIADDNALFREGMAQLLGQDAGLRIVGQARHTDEVLKKASLLRPDVVLMDLAMPRCGGIEATRNLLREQPAVKVCMLTSSEQEEDVFAAVRAGARGYLVKTIDIDRLRQGIQILADGGAVVMPALATRLLDEFSRMDQGRGEEPSELGRLSPREREVLSLIAQGASNFEIGRRLVISTNTVKVHLRNILDKLQLRNRQQAAGFAAQEGLLAAVTAGDRQRARRAG